MTPESTTGCPACDALPASQRRAAHALCHPRILDALSDLLTVERQRYVVKVRESSVSGVVLGSR